MTQHENWIWPKLWQHNPHVLHCTISENAIYGEIGEWMSNVKVWKHDHRGKDPENHDQLCTPVAETPPVSY
jgi:hypothetical protein